MSTSAGLEPEAAEWVRALTSSGRTYDAAVERLHEMLVGVARAELRRRASRSHFGASELDDLAYHAAADALVAVVAKVKQFRGESRFTTWAYRFVIFEVSNKVGRHFWRGQEPSIEDEDWELLPDRFGFDSERRAEWRDLIAALRRAIDEDLTPHQRTIFVAIVLRGVPLDALVAELGSNRNAIYKSLFDARRKLRRSLAANGYMDPDPLEQS